MQNLTKKLFILAAGITSVAGIISLSWVNAAEWLQNATAEMSGTNLVVTWVQLSGGTNYDFSSTWLSDYNVFSWGNVELTWGQLTLVDSGSAYFVLSWADSLNDWDYSVNFETTDGDYGAAYFSVWGTNEVTVNARVEPILRMALSQNNLDFGTLETSTGSVSMSGEVWTNAVDGLTVSVLSENGWLYSDSANYTINNDNDSENYTFESTTWSIDNGVSPSVLSNTSVTDSSSQSIYTTNAVESFSNLDDFIFTIKSKISEITPAAADYTDTVTFTVTANF